MHDNLANVATIWWEMGNRRQVRWATITAWCFGAANAADSDDWWTLYHVADERIPEDYDRVERAA